MDTMPFSTCGEVSGNMAINLLKANLSLDFA